MQMHLIIIGLFAITVLMAFLEDNLKESNKVAVLTGYVVFMIVLATTKSIEHTADAAAYEEMFYGHDNIFTSLVTEPTFIYLSQLVLSLGGTIVAIFFIYALLAIPAKMKILYGMTPYVFTALLIYIPIYFEVQDLIQIRVSVAAMFLLASLRPLSEKKYSAATLLMIAAILFHYSAILYLPFLFIGNRKLNVTMRVVIALLLPLCFAMYLLKLDLLSLIPSFSGAIDYKLEGYKESSEKGQWDDLYPLYAHLYYLSKCAMLLLCLYYYDFLAAKHKMAPLLISLFAASTLFLPAMATIPVLASRVSDLYGIVDCIVFTFLLYLVEPRHIARAAIAVVGAYMIVFNILFTEYFT